MKRKCHIDDNVRALGEIFRQAGHELYLVGGAVRDWLLGLENDDWDFTTDALPEEVMALFPRRCIPTGIEHGTVTVRFRGRSYEVTTFRSEGSYSDGRHPDSVTFVRSLESDLERRDFTINAFAANTSDGIIIDLHNGMRDLKDHVVRAIGDPEERFREDALRMLRACRFASRLDFTLDEATEAAATKLSGNIRLISAERIREELFKLLMGRNPVRGLELMRRTGLLAHVLPELMDCYGVEQVGRHHEDVYHHCLTTLEMARRHSYPLIVRIAALLHDVAKPRCLKVEADGTTSFHGHDRLGGEMVDAMMRRLKSSNEERELASLLVREHMFNYTGEWSDGAVRRFIRRVGAQNIEPLIQLRIADAQAMDPSCRLDGLWAFEERMKGEIGRKVPLSVKDLAVDGNDLMALGIPRGPMLGKVLSALLEAVLDDEGLNSPEVLSDFALRKWKELS